MTLERLYKKTATGATQIIDMTITDATYTRSWGKLDGKMQTKTTTAKPKNVGRTNATTAEEQAILEAKAVWVKKQKANYSTSQEAPVLVKLPMKVNDYHKHKKKITFPCFTSPKLNGVNCEYRLVPGTDGNLDELKLLSRGGEDYPIPPHQEEQVLMLLQALETNSINGEMYCHGEYLQDIMAATKKHNKLTPRLSFNVFDFPEVKGTYQDRCSLMYAKNQAYTKFDTSTLPFVTVWTANSHEELDNQHRQCVDAGYEGLIIRNAKAEYKYNTRSLDVFKYKIAQDAEFEVLDFNIDKNGHTVFHCIYDEVWESMAPDGVDDRDVLDSASGYYNQLTFKVKLKGTNEERLVMAANAEDYIGLWLKVEYEMLSKDGVPQKPVGIMFRKVGDNGEAIE